MTKKLIISKVGVIRQIAVKSELEPVQHPKAATGHYPRDFMSDACVGANHLTFVIVNEWNVTTGTHDPYSLKNAVLKRLNNTVSEVTQTGLGVTVGTYSIALTGAGLIIFNDGGDYEWSTGAITKQERLVNQTATVKFKNKSPQSITIRLENDADEVSAVTLSSSAGSQQIVNYDFTQVETHFYDVESFWTASLFPEIVPPDTLGYLEGFNQHNLYTIFE